MRVEIINTGNELLNGKIKNTSVEWLIKNLNRLGARIIQYSVIPDELEFIKSTLQAAVERSAEVIIITGGLGATYDDMTLNAVAQVVKCPLRMNDDALKMVDSKFEYAKKLGWTYSDEITDSWRKMAIIPVGSIPLENPPGAAPGVQIEYQGKTIFCLPGPPNELQAIFRKYLRPFFKDHIKEQTNEIHFYLTGVIEPTISGIIYDTFTKFQGVWIKSLPMLHTGKLMLEMHFTLQDGYDSPELLEKAKIYFLESFVKLGQGKVIHDPEAE